MLTSKQARFVAEYLIDLNGTQAAIRAGYSPKTANEQAARLLAKISVRAAVAEGEARQMDRAHLTADRVLEELRRVAFAQLPVLYDDNQQLRRFADLTDEERSLIAAYKLTTTARGTTEEIKIWPKVQALEVLARHFKLLDLAPPPLSAQVLNVMAMTDAELKTRMAELVAKLD